ncbi:MAG: rod shape-determining protein [Streptosporangiales bacterium]
MSGVGIDLGTANTLVCHTRRGIVVQEPSVMVMRHNGTRHRKPLAVGQDALDVLDRVAPGLTVVRPLYGGVITDLDVSRRFIRTILRRGNAHAWMPARTHAAIGVPVGATALERRALMEAAEAAHVARPMLVAEPLAGAVGCGIDPSEARTHMVVDIGGGTSEVTAFCFGEVVAHRSLRTAGNDMTLAVHRYLFETYGIDAAETEAEKLKINASTGESPLVARGREAVTGRPRLVSLTIEEVRDAVKPVTDVIVDTLAACLRDLPARCVTDVLDEGIVAFGGGSLLTGFDGQLADALGMPVHLADRPMTCVAEGAARCANDGAMARACSAA